MTPGAGGIAELSRRRAYSGMFGSLLRPLFLSLVVLPQVLPGASPLELKFTRQAVKRMVFDESQAIPLAAVEPSKVVGLEVMHPLSHRGTGQATVRCEKGAVQFESPAGADTSLWFGGFNPFATYSVETGFVRGPAKVGLEFRHEGGSNVNVDAAFRDGRCESIGWSLTRDGKKLVEGQGKLPVDLKGRFRLLVQMQGVGFNVYVGQEGLTRLVARADVAEHLDFRRREVFQRMSSHLRVASDAAAYVSVGACKAELTPGMGQADIRPVTDEEGSPLMDCGRLWFTATVRGGGLPHPAQGVFSLDPGAFDPRFEGMIVFDRGDGLLRNDLASHLFLDRAKGEWRGWTTGFSAYGDPGKQEKKEILAVRSRKDPRRGFSVMKAAPTGLVGDYEDPHGVYEKASGKWRMLLCQNADGYKAAVFESSRWDGGFTRIAGPVDADSTGTTLQVIDGTRYAFFGSADRSFHVCSFPDLKPLGKLDVGMPPWNETTNARVWPCVVPLPEGYAAPYLMLTFDRANFPGMEGPNWTYGAMYLYHGWR